MKINLEEDLKKLGEGHGGQENHLQCMKALPPSPERRKHIIPYIP